jgi:hypothetical protein
MEKCTFQRQNIHEKRIPSELKFIQQPSTVFRTPTMRKKKKTTTHFSNFPSSELVPKKKKYQGGKKAEMHVSATKYSQKKNPF